MRTVRVAIATSLLLGLVHGDVGADVVPVGGEFQVNTYTTANQEKAQVSADASGGFVVVWQSGYYGETGADGAQRISARRYDAAGTPAGAEFVVNATPDAQVDPAISVAPSGGFVIAWGGHASYSGPSSSAAGVFVQGFTAAGSRRGGEQRANAGTGGFRKHPRWQRGRQEISWWSGRARARTTRTREETGAARVSSAGATIARVRRSAGSSR